MENNKFSSIMMEEARSARIGRSLNVLIYLFHVILFPGRMEDMEDMRREEEDLKRKKKRR